MHSFCLLFVYWSIVAVVFQSLIRVQLFATPWTAACPASLSFTISQSLLKLMSIESLKPSSHLVLCFPFSSCPQSFPTSWSFLMNWLFTSGGQSIGVSAAASVLPMNIQDWFPLGWAGWISLVEEQNHRSTRQGFDSEEEARDFFFLVSLNKQKHEILFPLLFLVVC